MEEKILKDYIEAHKYSSNHKEELLTDKFCGCFYCLEIFKPDEINEWIEDEKGTAVCPYCGIDAVIGESSGYPVTKESMEKMSDHWF